VGFTTYGTGGLMGWLGGAFKTVTGFFTGAGGGKIIDAADELHLSAEERQVLDQKDLASARAMQASSGNTGFDMAVNCLSRLVRPVITFWLVGGMMGFYTFPSIDSVPPFYQKMIVIVITFWFGGRAIMKDIPTFVRALKS
jgi:hypothetical protein